MGTVYKVRHVHLDEVRVVKVMRADILDDPDARARFVREARLAKSLHHENIAVLHDFAEDRDGSFYMVLEFVDGPSLAEPLGQGDALPVGTAVEIAVQVLSALGHLHGKGIVHRDVSPENILLTLDESGRPLVKLIDLGIAKETAGDGLTLSGMFLGKLKYASPEQLGALAKGEVIDGTKRPLLARLRSLQAAHGRSAVSGRHAAGLRDGPPHARPEEFRGDGPLPARSPRGAGHHHEGGREEAGPPLEQRRRLRRRPSRGACSPARRSRGRSRGRSVHRAVSRGPRTSRRARGRRGDAGDAEAVSAARLPEGCLRAPHGLPGARRSRAASCVPFAAHHGGAIRSKDPDPPRDRAGPRNGCRRSGRDDVRRLAPSPGAPHEGTLPTGRRPPPDLEPVGTRGLRHPRDRRRGGSDRGAEHAAVPLAPAGAVPCESRGRPGRKRRIDGPGFAFRRPRDDGPRRPAGVRPREDGSRICTVSGAKTRH